MAVKTQAQEETPPRKRQTREDPPPPAARAPQTREDAQVHAYQTREDTSACALDTGRHTPPATGKTHRRMRTRQGTTAAHVHQTQEETPPCTLDTGRHTSACAPEREPAWPRGPCRSSLTSARAPGDTQTATAGARGRGNRFVLYLKEQNLSLKKLPQLTIKTCRVKSLRR